MNSYISSKEIESVTKNLPAQKTHSDSFSMLSFQIYKDKIGQSYKFFQIIDNM